MSLDKVHDITTLSASLYGRRSAIIDERGALDYQSLDKKIDTMARRLREIGVGAGHGIGVMARNGRAFVIAAFGALRCGATIAPMAHYLKRQEADEMLRAMPLHAVVDDGGGVKPVTDAESIQIEIADVSPLRFTWTGVGRSDPFSPEAPDAAFVRFTSGTTGTAKGVMLNHKDVLDRIDAANGGLELHSEDTVAWVLPMAYHFLVSIVLYLKVGAAIAVCRDHLAQTVLETANRCRATFLYASPLHYRLLASERSETRFTNLRKAVSTLTTLSPETAEAFLDRYGLPIAQAYGIIEVGMPMINFDHAVECPKSVGRPLSGYEVALLDEDLHPAPSGEVGEVAIRGPGMFSGYLTPATPASSVLRDGFFLTGDLARRDSRGLYTIVGRSKSVINVLGNKVFPEEVEEILNRNPLVAESRVTGMPHPQMGEVIHAAVVARDALHLPDVEELLSSCRKRLSSYKVPHSVAFVREIERSPSGKIRRHKSPRRPSE